jgi:FtsP/CotA-like multicopper oxidase with cupredoxin domain
MKKLFRQHILRSLTLAVALLWGAASGAIAMHGNVAISGVTGPDFQLTAKAGNITTGDGNNVYFWGYANGNDAVQYPGPTLIVNEGDTVTIRLVSQIPAATSLVVPGFTVSATGGQPGLLTREAPADGITAVTYTFTADRPGTFTYYSGTHSDLQVEMGLLGALIVRPANGMIAGCNPADPMMMMSTAYGDCRSAYDQEYLYLLSEMDLETHILAEKGLFDQIDTTKFWPVYWFVNGRTAPDTMLSDNVSWLPNQPYGAMTMMNVGERVLMRMIGGGRDLHPFHTHGNNFDQIARDGWLLATPTDPGTRTAEVGVIPDKAVSDFTQTVVPGATHDAIFAWTGRGLGWDIYDGSNPDHMMEVLVDANADGFDDTTYEYIADHGKPFPVILPGQQEVTFGAFYSGSPFLGAAGSLPPGEGGNNPNSGFAFMWHSHNEKEMTNNDIFPGGLMTMVIVEAPVVEAPMPMQ